MYRKRVKEKAMKNKAKNHFNYIFSYAYYWKEPNRCCSNRQSGDYPEKADRIII